MIYIIAGTDRPNSNSRKVSDIVLRHYQEAGEPATILDLHEFPMNKLSGTNYGKDLEASSGGEWIDKLSSSDGIHIVCPEYNGSMPGALKYFIDFWRYPETFEARPVAFIGLGGRFGGLRPVEHLQQIFGYRNAYQFPERVFLANVWNILKDDGIADPLCASLMEKQVKGFVAFIKALKKSGLHTSVKSQDQGGS